MTSKHILAKLFYPITIIATDIEVRIRLLKDYPPLLISILIDCIRDDDDLSSGRIGYCVNFWCLKKGILKERYNIDWKTPWDRNPVVADLQPLAHCHK